MHFEFWFSLDRDNMSMSCTYMYMIIIKYLSYSLPLFQNSSSEERIIKQFQFSGWSEQVIPNPTALLEYRYHIKAWTSTSNTPVLVHCG